MRTFISFIKEFRFPKKEELSSAIASLSKKQFFFFITSVIIALITMICLLQKVNNSFMVTIPSGGGTITEGIIGMPILVNPVLALSDADKDLTAIVYSGLMRKMPDGTFIPDLAESYTVSEDGMTYTFILKKDLKFHDGTALTSDDVIFTIEKIKDVLIKSPRKARWDGVQVEKKDAGTVVFTLKQPFISFMDNTTIGILPVHIWKNVTASEFGLSPINIKAIGSGPYQIESVSKNNDGIPEIYKLKRFANFALGVPHIQYMNIISYANEKDLIQDLLSHTIDQAGGLSPENAIKIENSKYTIHTATLPRIFGLFYNSTANKIFNDKVIIRAFNQVLDRKAIVNEVLGGYGVAIYSPIPETIIRDDLNANREESSLDDIKSTLDKNGWVVGADGIRVKGGKTTVTQTKKVGKKTVTQKVVVNGGPITRLAFSLTTGDTPELNKASSLIKDQLEKIGAEVTIKVYETGPLNQLIRTRNYESLFFGQIVNHESDLFSFWHSSQKNDPGLNIALYSNKNVDTILEAAQKTLNRDNRISKYKNLINEFNNDTPALLIYSPKYLYATSSKLNNIMLDTLTTPSDRFISLYTWYADTDRVWKIFTK